MIEEILAFENSSNVLEYRYQYKNTLIWPFIRYNIIHEICYKAAGLPSPKQSADIVPFSAQTFIRRNIAGNPFLSSKKDIMFLYSGLSSNIKLENGKWFNRLFDYYYEQNPKDTYMLENAGCLPYQKRTASHVKYMDFINFIINNKVKDKEASTSDRNTCGKFITYLRNNIPFRMSITFWNSISQLILYYAVTIPYQRQIYQRLFQYVQPKVVFVEDGCYGAGNACIFEILHSLKIKSIELQHGWIGKNHEAYNYSDLLCQSKEYRKYMPSAIGLFGSFWSEQIRVPIKKYILGNPHFTCNSQSVNTEKKQENYILFIASIQYPSYIKLFDSLLPKLGQDHFIEFRLHPNFKKESRLFRKYCRYKNFIINSEGSLYEAFNRCEYVTGDMSTALFEAAAFGKKVLICKNPSSNYYNTDQLWPSYKNADEFLEIIQKEEFDHSIGNHLFSIDWKKNYHLLLKKSGVNL